MDKVIATLIFVALTIAIVPTDILVSLLILLGWAVVIGIVAFFLSIMDNHDDSY